MKKLFCIVGVFLFCTGCSFIKEAPDSDTGNTTADTSEDNINSADSNTTGNDNTDDNGQEEVVINGIVISDDDSSVMIAVKETGGGLQAFDPVSVHYSDVSSLNVGMGDIIKISFDGRIAESYPSQIWADNIDIMEKVQDNWPATSTITKDYSFEEAVADNCFVVGNDKTESADRMNSFVNNTINGMVGYLRKVMYTTEGDPVITDFIYDGNKYYVFEDMSRDVFNGGEDKLYKKIYSYINTYEKESNKVIYLANRNDITNEEYEKNTTSSNSKDRIDTYAISY
ncbi:DUF4362 domain-containing protein [Anaerocolumna sp. MB42-C2]|uniref:DUF4362 domain-containing protein n=1 Tax=Anaerocolumna sp. MB42-C2 TaxID=3070997 RepID=UPI0027E0914C|nr:DUF4362 domain-containing protein [Anaerocolumna sp. MB42-C2]WMJ86284.1 DUF4362 domain-containing protein [Anaerocolumna sp. MB42-C2]